MGTDNRKKNEPKITHTTRIGSVTGQVHTGSGNIIVKSFSSVEDISNKEEFLAALHVFKAEVKSAREQGLKEEIADDIIIEVDAAGREAVKETPKAERITKRLENAKKILDASTKVTTSAIWAIGKMKPLIENAVEIVGKIF